MVVFILKIIFFVVTTLSNILSRLIFTLSANVFVLLIQGFRSQGEASKGVLEQIVGVLRSCFEYLVEFLLEVISTVVSTVFDLLKDGVMSCVTTAGSTIGGLMEQTRESLDGFVKEYLVEIVGSFNDMVWTIVTDLWNNYIEAVGYVTENA